VTQKKNQAEGSKETELKLTCRSEDIAKILGLSYVAEHLRYEPEHCELASRYFDTPDCALNEEDVELRIRREGDRWIQTMKVAEQPGDALGVYERMEYDAEVDDAELNLDLLPAQNGHGKLPVHKSKIQKKLQPVFETKISRTLHDLEIQGDLVEMVVDEGEVSAGGKVTALCQIELELKRGRPETLYEVASQLAKQVPVRLGSPRKADVGYRLLNHREPEPQKITPLKFRAKIPVEEAFLAILTNCLELIRGNEAAILEGRNIDAVHQMRIGLRRLKSLFSVFSIAIPKRITAPFKERLDVIGVPLGVARDWDVFVEERLRPMLSEFPEEKLFSDLQKVANRKRGYAYRKLRNAILSREYGATIIELNLWIVKQGWRGEMSKKELKALNRPVRSMAATILEKAHQGVMEQAGSLDLATDEEWHKLRLAIKKQRYTVDFFQSCFPGKPAKSYGKAARRLQDHLGKLNDVANASAHLEELAGQDEASPTHMVAIAFRGWQSRERTLLRDGIVEKWKAFATAPKFWTTPKK
tara:strand:+ start:4488 stop:6074 length:1587 start_codon:yes stop_codon:yes gene_type:complete